MNHEVDLETFFKEQEDRMNMSDSDWESYEERVHQMRKRKREKKIKAKEASKLKTGGKEDSDEAGPSKKKARKTDIPARTSAQTSNQASNVNSSGLPQDVITSSSSHLKASKGTVLTRVRRMSTSSEFTSPAASSEDVSCAQSPKPPSTESKSKKSKGTRKSTTITQKDDAIKAALQAKKETEREKKLQDQKEALMTPTEYALTLQQKWQAKVAKMPAEKLFLKDAVVFLVFEEKKKSTKDTRIKLDIIAKNGGQVATNYDPETVTHIIPGGSSITMKKTLQALGLKSLAEIPLEIHTVKWDWIVSGLTKKKPDSELMHELYKERLAYKYLMPSANKGKGKAKEANDSIAQEHSVIEEFSVLNDTPDPDTRPKEQRKASDASTSNSGLFSAGMQPSDPLLPFYAEAREQADASGSEDESINITYDNSKGLKLKGYQCDHKGQAPAQESPNWDIIEKLNELKEMHRDMGTTDDKWRVISYQKAIGSLKRHPTRIKSYEEALTLSGVSDKTADKIMEIVKTGNLQRIHYTKTADLDAIRAFNGIYGVGTTIARKWYNQGLHSLDDLRAAVKSGKVKLTTAQEIGLQYYNDINDRMPREEAEEIFMKIKPIALSLDPNLSLEIMGSFRRGKASCGDIDILLTRPTADGKTHAGILLPLWNRLQLEGIITENLALPEDWNGLEASYRGICRRDSKSRRRRIDILCIPYECRGAARIYYTGDDIFNRSIRLKANKMGMSLNQRGLFHGVIRDPKDRTKKMDSGSLLCGDSERKIFEILGVPWQEPHERVRN